MNSNSALLCPLTRSAARARRSTDHLLALIVPNFVPTAILLDSCIRSCVSPGSAQRFRRTGSVNRWSASYAATVMSNGDSQIWWTYDHAPTRWAIVGSFVVAWLLSVAVLYSDIVKVLAARPWWEDWIVAGATVAVPVLAFLELRHSGEANRLRSEANRLREEMLPSESQHRNKIGQYMRATKHPGKRRLSTKAHSLLDSKAGRGRANRQPGSSQMLCADSK